MKTENQETSVRYQQIEDKIPSYIWDICHRFYEAGEDAYLVGGSLRDIMLGRSPSDFDLATSATPQRTIEIFFDKKVIETGIKHGTVTVIVNSAPVEITTFRIDGDYTDSRHPDGVSFTGRIEDDLARRDFTVNAMAYNDRSGLVDPYGGQADLGHKIIRAVGEPERRFSEDALRIMRGLRFSAGLEFDIDESTLSAMGVCRDRLSCIAKERIASEFTKLLLSPDPENALLIMIESGVMPYVTGGYEPSRSVISSLRKMPANDGARLGFFLSDTNEESAKTILRSLKYSNAITSAALAVLRGSSLAFTSQADIRRLVAICGKHTMDAVLASVLKGNSESITVEWSRTNTAPCTLSALALTGKDLIDMGIEGRTVGVILSALLDRVIEDPTLNEKQILLDIVKNEYGRQKEN